MPSTTMTAEQFRIVFQVTKELCGVPEERRAAAGIPRHHCADILELARGVRQALTAGGVEIRFVSAGSPDRRTLRIPGPPGTEGSAHSAEEFPADTARHWRTLIDVTVESLGSDELRFRTGYGKEEVASACSPLDGLFAD
ncbi:hypothetical protein ACLF6K_17900 [Streptomyces xanthophaeus]|uniref:hypothetical protein n=1 Tax=Streptomyces xanthophaeus TaxID=67385 RepID=UPI00398FFE49